ncbi:lactate racemase domain-containing protein [Clostridium aestuarii]|uniref:Lactate racemase domain-containing protein n=1 Tax=Clostridium aestuarii TaxID=338193 RepID=A0ABT4CYR7_9CLOT|nr:lactate racemase domain-containing protein [Clostridium aestuarii]MCY6484129.1 lactate racemase domain-containing protein [Clostridium aestuarii]
MEYPKMYKVRQNFDNSKIRDIKKEIIKECGLINIGEKITPGMKIAVTAGSRGISNISEIIKIVCDYLKNLGAHPFIIPAMGSHGGASANGQVNVLKKLGITEKSMGYPIFSDMETIFLEQTEDGAPVYMDKNAYYSDGIVVVNRIKPHTDFNGDTESGLLKMISVGLGKAKGCSSMHTYGLRKTIPKAAKIAMDKAPILFGIAILENSKDETYKLKAVLPDEFEKVEKKLLNEVKNIVPKLPSDFYDILIIKEMGKMFSGTGVDTKVIGRMMVFGEEEPKKPVIKKIVILNLSDSSYGNALGIGLADITTKKLVDKIDFDAMYANVIPTTFLSRAKIPITMINDKKAIETAFETIGSVIPKEAKIAIIDNTLQLEELYVSEMVLKDLDKIQILNSDVSLKFDDQGNIKL